MTAHPAFDMVEPGRSQLAVHPFDGNTGPFYNSPDFAQTAKAIEEDIRCHAELIALTGETGTGKTLLVHHLIEILGGHIAFVLLLDPRCSFQGFVRFACRELGLGQVEEGSSPEQEVEALREHLIAQRQQGRPVVVFIDEAQEMSEELLVDLLLFSGSQAPGDPLLQIALIGLPALLESLGKPALRELTHERFKFYNLPPLQGDQVAAFIRQRLHGFYGEEKELFSTEAIDKIATYSRGIPRSINTICSLALFTAQLEQRRPITGEFIDEVAQRFLLTSTGQSSRGAEESVPSLVIDNAIPKSGYLGTQAKAPAPPEYKPKLIRLVDPSSEQESLMSRLDNLNKILKNLQSESPGVEASALISEDGLMIASALPQDLDETRVAGMTATLLNLGTRAATELRRGDVQEVIVRGELGYAVMISVGRGALLLVLANEHSKLGLIFFDMREAIKAIKTIL